MTKALSVPPYNIRRILALRNKLRYEVLLPFHGLIHEAESFHEMVQAVRQVIPGATHSALLHSMRHLAGITITAAHIRDLSWRLAGNTHHLRRDVAVVPWTSQPFAEWALMQIVSVTKTTALVAGVANSKIEKPAACLSLFVLAGLPAGITIERTWTQGTCFRLRTKLGFSKFDSEKYRSGSRRADRPLRDLLELTRLRFLGLFTPETCAGSPNFSDVRCSASQVSWNREIMTRRRRQNFSCPMDYPIAEVPCYRCHVGYEACSAGCHPKTYDKRVCANCKQLSFFESVDSTCCINCALVKEQK